MPGTDFKYVELIVADRFRDNESQYQIITVPASTVFPFRIASFPRVRSGGYFFVLKLLDNNGRGVDMHHSLLTMPDRDETINIVVAR
ncbi:hypothetical protein V6R21_00385 [Limibacter armeniacum]|uniref:hypothetical protein n=1 Tax=Limibacter armeniacum TaxID=466084 RepID=UPI002FE6A254